MGRIFAYRSIRASEEKLYFLGLIMALEIIGASFGRTGTESMKRALELLGVGPCYHMYEVLAEKRRFTHWLSVLKEGAEPNWDETFAGFRATVDWPAACYWRELSEFYPQAKILLPVRSSESWYASMEKTILTYMRDPDAHPDMAQALRYKAFGGEVDNKAHVISVYERNISEVQSAFSAERLLTYELGSGWLPLCNFLDVPEPDLPYPSGNTTREFHHRGQELDDKRNAPDY